MKNIPVMITYKGETKLYVFPHFTVGGDCTGKTTKKSRCRNVAWDQGQVAGYTYAFMGDRMVNVYGPLTGDVARRYLEQRCRVHDTPEAEADCDPEWELLDLARHADLTSDPHLGILLAPAGIPSVRILALAMRDHYTLAERQVAADILTSGKSTSLT